MARAVHLVTPVPGPRSQEILSRRQQAVPRGLATNLPVVIASAHGARLTDVDGNVYVDFAGGVGCLNVGSTNPEVVEAIRAQAGRFIHGAAALAMYEEYVCVAEAVARISPLSGSKRALLVNSGSEAIENAVKIARRFTDRPAIVTFRNAFHGRTLLTMSLSANVNQKRGFGPFAPEIYRADYPYPYRSPHDSEDACGEAAFAEFSSTVDDEVGPSQVAAVVFEVIQGEGGFIVPPANFVRAIRDYCTRHGIMLVVDEIQSGLCRTGRMFACGHFRIEPDLVAVGKSLAAGLPLAAVVGRAEVMDAADVGGLGGTYMGNPVACAAALRVMDILERDNYAEKARRIGATVRGRFRAMRDRYDLVGDVRGLGAMMAMELVTDRTTKTPATEAADEVQRYCYAHGLVIARSGMRQNVIRFLGPLVLTDDELDEGLDILEEAIDGSSR